MGHLAGHAGERRGIPRDKTAEIDQGNIAHTLNRMMESGHDHVRSCILWHGS